MIVVVAVSPNEEMNVLEAVVVLKAAVDSSHQVCYIAVALKLGGISRAAYFIVSQDED